MRIVLLAFGSSLAVLWLFTAYEIVRNLRARVAFGYGGLIARICTPACITSAIAVFAGVILLRTQSEHKLKGKNIAAFSVYERGLCGNFLADELFCYPKGALFLGGQWTAGIFPQKVRPNSRAFSSASDSTSDMSSDPPK